MKKQKIIIRDQTGFTCIVPQPEKKVWFNCEYRRRSEAYDTGEVSLSEFLTISFESLRNICEICTSAQLKKLRQLVGGSHSKKAESFKKVIESYTSK